MKNNTKTTKPGVLLYLENYKILRKYSTEDKAALFDAIFLYSLGESLPKLSPKAQSAFEWIQLDLDKDSESYQRKCEKLRENAYKRWGNDSNKLNTIASKSNQLNANRANSTELNSTEKNNKNNVIQSHEEIIRAFEILEDVK